MEFWIKYKNWFFTGLFAGTVLAACGDSGTDSVENRAPRITSSSSVEAAVDEAFSYTVSVTDPDGNSITISFENLPDWLLASGNTVSGTPDSSDSNGSFIVIASDGELADTLIVSYTIVEQITFISYSSEIQPIFNNTCGGSSCHIGGTASGLSLSNYTSLMNGGNSGAVVVIGNSNSSKIIRRLEGTITPQMPLGRAPLSASDIQKIRDWIDEGAMNN